MRMVAPRTGAYEITVAEEQEQYRPVTIALYAYADGSHGKLSRWKPSDDERAAIAAGEDIYVQQLYFGDNTPMTPLIVRCGPGDFTMPANPERDNG